VVPGVGAFQLAADALAGSGDVAALLGEQEVCGVFCYVLLSLGFVCWGGWEGGQA
jgi:hypothetical protein